MIGYFEWMTNGLSAVFPAILFAGLITGIAVIMAWCIVVVIFGIIEGEKFNVLFGSLGAIGGFLLLTYILYRLVMFI